MKLIGITCSIDEKRIYLNRDYIEKLLELGLTPYIVTPQIILNGNQALTERLSALIISGGGDINPTFYFEKNISCKKLVPRQRTEAEIKLLKEFIKTGKPILGICYGMQLMNVFLGGTLYQDIKTEITHTEGFHVVEVFDDSFLPKGIYTVNTSHHQAVKDLGQGLLPFCTSADTIVEGIYLKEHPFFLGVQWHPERHHGELSNLLWQSFLKALNNSPC